VSEIPLWAWALWVVWLLVATPVASYVGFRIGWRKGGGS
jgi:hypothetical protein